LVTNWIDADDVVDDVDTALDRYITSPDDCVLDAQDVDADASTTYSPDGEFVVEDVVDDADPSFITSAEVTTVETSVPDPTASVTSPSTPKARTPKLPLPNPVRYAAIY
jgi:hypothetical protein